MPPNDLFGTFSEPGTLALGDPYDKSTKKRDAGSKQKPVKPFVVSHAHKAGRSPDVYLDKAVRSLREGDRYIDAWILDKRLTRTPGKNVSDKPFYRSTATRNSVSCGPGSADGCLSVIPLDVDGSAAARRSAPPRRDADVKRNMYTSTPKRGGFGRPWKDNCLGDPPKYYADVYEAGRALEKEMRSKARSVSAKPFITMGRSNVAFTPDHESVVPHAGPAGTKQRPATAGPAFGRSSGSGNTRPWRPSSPSKKGAAFCTLSKVGRDFVPDPVLEAKFHAKAHGSVAPFRPVSGSHARLSMWTVNPYATEPRAPRGEDFTLL